MPNLKGTTHQRLGKICNDSSAKFILGDPGADKGGEGKSKQAEKYGTKKSKERREEPLGTMSYETSSNWSSPPLSAPGSPRMC